MEILTNMNAYSYVCNTCLLRSVEWGLAVSVKKSIRRSDSFWWLEKQCTVGNHSQSSYSYSNQAFIICSTGGRWKALNEICTNHCEKRFWAVQSASPRAQSESPTGSPTSFVSFESDCVAEGGFPARVHVKRLSRSFMRSKLGSPSSCNHITKTIRGSQMNTLYDVHLSRDMNLSQKLT